MKHVLKFIQENPYAILVGFVLAVISGIMTIATSWTSFKNLLDAQVSVPYWVIGLFFIAFIVSLLFRTRNTNDIAEIKLVEGKAFGTQTIKIEGKHFVRCAFKGTKFIIEGRNSFGLEGCTLDGVSFAVDGPAANTLLTLTDLYKIPELRPMIEGTLDNIKSNSHPHTPGSVDI